MGLIKRDRIEEGGTILLEKAPAFSLRRKRTDLAPSVAQISGGDISEVKSEAQRIIRDAMGKADALQKEAHESGREEGRLEAAGKIEEALGVLNQAVLERKQIVKDSEGEILRLAIKVAEQIIRSEVSLHRDVCLNIVAEAIARVSDREQIIVKVNREDAEYLKRYKDRLSAMLDGVKSFSIIEDSAVEPGGCVIETNLGFIDARIATKLKSIEEALRKVSSEKENN